MASTTPQAGGRITAALLAGIAPLAVIKGADESVTSSTTLQNDDALVVAVAASASYLIVCYLDYEGGTQGSSDIKWGWTGPSGYTLRYGLIDLTTAGTANVSLTKKGTDVPAAGSAGAANLQSAIMIGSLITSSTAGNLQLQWAQSTSSGTATIVHAQSFLSLWRIS